MAEPAAGADGGQVLRARREAIVDPRPLSGKAFGSRGMTAGRRKVWMVTPHGGGSRIPPALQQETRRRILAHANEEYRGRFDRIDVSFRGQFCYIDAYQGGDTVPTHLCRLRYFSGHDRWSVAFYTYSHEQYEPSFFASGEAFGTPEEGFDVGAVYLR